MFRMRVLSHEIRTAFEPYHEIVKGLFSNKKAPSVSIIQTRILLHLLLPLLAGTSSAHFSQPSIFAGWAGLAECWPGGRVDVPDHVNFAAGYFLKIYALFPTRFLK